MSLTPTASKEYLKNSVMTASPEQLHLMLLDGAIRFATQAREAIEAGQAEATFHAIERAQRIVVEMAGGLRREINPELVDRMTGLYGFILRRLVEGNARRDTRAIDEALRILRHQRETWALLIQRISQEIPVPIGVTNPAPADGEPATSTFVAEG